MKTISTTAIIALMAATLGVSAVAPVLAQEAADPAEQTQPADPVAGFRNGGPMGAGIGGVLGFERGSEGVEIALVRLSHAIELTEEQQALFDTLRTDALAAAETFEDAVEPLRPQPPVDGSVAEAPDPTERLANRIAMNEAQLAALNAIEPSFTAFFGSLTDEQKADLMPQRGGRGDRSGPGRDGMGQQVGHGPGAPGGHRPMGGQYNG